MRGSGGEDGITSSVRCLRPLSKHDIRELNLNKHTLTIKTSVLHAHVSADCRTSFERGIVNIARNYRTGT
jgi:hypothetical protein